MTALAAPPIRRGPLDGVAPVAGADLTLAPVGPLDKVAARGLGSPDRAGRVIETGRVAVWHLGPDEAIVVFPPDAVADASPAIASARSSVDVGSGYAVLRLSGPRSRALLAEACPVDLSERAVPDRGIVQASVANVRVVLARTDADGEPGFTLLVARDEARYLWDALCELGDLR